MQSSVIDIGSDTGDVYPIDFRIRTMGLLFVAKYSVWHRPAYQQPARCE
jgi:hypothetical protein